DAAENQGEDDGGQEAEPGDGTQAPGQGGSAGSSGDGSSGDGSAEGGSTTEPVAGGQDGPGAENLPTVPVEYADALVIAWGAGDQDAMAQLAPTGVVDVLGS